MTSKIVSISQELFDNLQIDLEEVPIEYLADYTAIAYFLTMEEPPDDTVSNLEKIRIYLGYGQDTCKIGHDVKFCKEPCIYTS